MSQFDVRVCTFCGKLFQSTGPNICPECSVKLDEDFVKVRDYLYDNPGNIDVLGIATNTGVSEKAVLRLIKDGRLARKVSEGNADLRCALCGAPISSGKLCRRCMEEWKTGMMKHDAPAESTGKQNTAPKDKNEKMHSHHFL